MTDGRAGITADLVARLVRTQFPVWADLPVVPVAEDGWDNRTYRLGNELVARLPTAEGYVAAVEKEHLWLPQLAPQLPVAIPQPVALGAPGAGYPFPWAIRRWLAGDVAERDRIADLEEFAVAVGRFVVALQAIDPTGGPLAGPHSFLRGTPPAAYDQEVGETLAVLDGRIDVAAARRVWSAALEAPDTGTPRWFHGDIARGNLLVRHGRLAAVIDFGTSGVGDPACDLVIAWTMFRGRSRAAFRRTVDQDGGTWARARGWALWKALITVAVGRDVAVNEDVIGEVLADHLWSC